MLKTFVSHHSDTLCNNGLLGTMDKCPTCNICKDEEDSPGNLGILILISMASDLPLDSDSRRWRQAYSTCSLRLTKNTSRTGPKLRFILHSPKVPSVQN